MGGARWGVGVAGRLGVGLVGPNGVGGVRTFIKPKRVFVWRSKERAPKSSRIGNLEKSCGGLENSCLHMEKSGKMLEKINSIINLNLAT